MRYLPLSNVDRKNMLSTIGADTIDALFSDVPSDALNVDIDLPTHLGELLSLIHI